MQRTRSSLFFRRGPIPPLRRRNALFPGQRYCSSSSLSPSSMGIDCVVTMGTVEVADEIRLFLASLSATEGRTRVNMGHPPLRVVVGTTSELRDEMLKGAETGSSNGRAPPTDGLDVQYLPCLDAYTARGKEETGARLDRATMEKTPGKFYATQHTDFMMEKATLMEYAMTTHDLVTTGTQTSSPLESGVVTPSRRSHNNVLFLDCDIVTLAPLPHVPSRAALGLCRHHIRHQDEQMFGHYNGGWVYLNANPTMQESKEVSGGGKPAPVLRDSPLATSLLYQWRRATHQSRYFDQASLEDVARNALEQQHLLAENTDISIDSATDVFHQFSPCSNFGYWRMFQTERPATQVAADFDLLPAKQLNDDTAEWLLHYQGSVLQSIHTHFHMPWATNKSMPLFNQCIKRWMKEAVQQSSLKKRKGGQEGSASRSDPHPYELILPFM